MLGDSSGSATFNLPDPQNQDEIQNMSTQSPLCWEQFGENSIVAFSMIFCCVSTCPEEMHFWPFFAKEILSMTNRTISTIYHRQNDEATCFCLRVGNRTCSCVFYNRYQKNIYIYICCTFPTQCTWMSMLCRNDDDDYYYELWMSCWCVDRRYRGRSGWGLVSFLWLVEHDGDDELLMWRQKILRALTVPLVTLEWLEGAVCIILALGAGRRCWWCSLHMWGGLFSDLFPR